MTRTPLFSYGTSPIASHRPTATVLLARLHPLEVVSLFILILLGVTFILGLIWAAFQIDKEKERQIHDSEKSENDDWYKPGMLRD
jgi:hypothetical protein